MDLKRTVGEISGRKYLNPSTVFCILGVHRRVNGEFEFSFKTDSLDWIADLKFKRHSMPPQSKTNHSYLLCYFFFLHLNSFGGSCQVLEISAVEMSAFSQIYWNWTALKLSNVSFLGNHDPLTQDNPQSSSSAICSWDMSSFAFIFRALKLFFFFF